MSHAPDLDRSHPFGRPEEPPGPSLVESAQDAGWAEHQAQLAADEPRPEELPGGYVWQSLYDEATAAAGGDPRDLWNRLAEDERARYSTLAAVQRRQRRERSAEPAEQPARTHPLPFVSARELAASTPPDVPWIVRHYLARGAVTELDGAAKRAGKTTLLGHLFAAILGRRPFLDQPTAWSPIVYLTEMHDTPMRELLERVALTESDDLRILRWSDTRLVRWPDVVADATAECRDHHAEILVVDTLPQFAGIRGDSENDAGAALAAIEPLQAAAADGLAVCLVRHERKGGGEVGESGRGSTAFTGAVDIVVRLARPLNPPRPNVRELSVLSRFDGAPDQLMIELTEQGYEVLGEEQAVVFAEARSLVKSYLPNAPDGWAERELLNAIPHHSRTTIQRALESLMSTGEVVRSGLGKRGSPFRWARLSVDPAFLPGSPPPKGGEGAHPGQTRPDRRGHESSRVSDRMADIFASAELAAEEPEDVDEPEDLGAVTAQLFGDQPEARA